MRAVLDTNVVMSAIFFGGVPLDVLSLKSSVESLTQRCREAESAENIPRIQEE